MALYTYLYKELLCGRSLVSLHCTQQTYARERYIIAASLGSFAHSFLHLLYDERDAIIVCDIISVGGGQGED